MPYDVTTHIFATSSRSSGLLNVGEPLQHGLQKCSEVLKCINRESCQLKKAQSLTCSTR